MTSDTRHSRSLLLVDDDQQRLREVQTLLRGVDCSVRIADGEQEAERCMREDSAFSLVILSADSQAYDPIAVARRLRTVSGSDALPVLFLTDSDVQPFPVEAAYALGAVDDVCRARLGRVLPAKVRLLLASHGRSNESERELQQRVDALAESGRRTDDFLATLAHELRAPLAPIRNGLELLRLGGEDPSELEAIRGMMSRQVDQLSYLMDDLVDVTRLALDDITLKKERVDLRAVLYTALETVRPLVDGRGHELTVDLRAQSFPVEVDPVRIAQVIGNLLSNAVKYTPPGGRILVTAELDGSDVLLTVQDSGIGIPHKALASVFDMFNRVSRSEASVEGLGVGLALVRQLLKLHGGTVDGSSPGPGLGSTFRIRLPMSSSPVPAAAAPIATVVDRAPRPGRFRILIIEDDIDSGATMSRVLQHERQDTRVANSGAQALHIAAAFLPEIILMDIGLPDISGYELAPQLRAVDGVDTSFIVALTGYSGETDRTRSGAVGIDCHLVKPTRLERLRQLLVEVTERSGTRAEARVDHTDVALAISGIGGIDRENGFSMPATRAFMQDYIGRQPVALTVADARLPDCPLIVVNQAFCDLSGYPENDIIGTNCRFLQGRDRDQEGVRRLSLALRDHRDVEVFLHNFTRAGKPFVNLLRLYMLRDAHGVVRFILGSQLEASPDSFAAQRPQTCETNAALDIDSEEYPTLLPNRYRSLYAAKGALADTVAAGLQAHVSSLR